LEAVYHAILSRLDLINKNQQREGIIFAKKRQKSAAKADIKLRHPEQQVDEIWLCNVNCTARLIVIGWKTKRMGKVAYQEDNITPIENPPMFPVFIKRQEPQEQSEKCLAEDEACEGWLKKLLKS
jgi:hypothetical protein